MHEESRDSRQLAILATASGAAAAGAHRLRRADCCRSVGLVARVIEEAGISTVILNMMPAYQPSVGAPRVAAVSHPFGRPFGAIDDAETQRVVLRAALSVLESARTPGEVVQLPYEWHEAPKATKWEPDEPSPIVAMMLKAQPRG